jgi:hypothetical protein
MLESAGATHAPHTEQKKKIKIFHALLKEHGDDVGVDAVRQIAYTNEATWWLRVSNGGIRGGAHVSERKTRQQKSCGDMEFPLCR